MASLENLFKSSRRESNNARVETVTPGACLLVAVEQLLSAEAIPLWTGNEILPLHHICRLIPPQKAAGRIDSTACMSPHVLR
jgi:hypothetical protein